MPGPHDPLVALTIAGSDSSAGAGLQADLKTFAAHGVFGTTAITAVTAQNTLGVQGVFPVPPAFVDDQITSVLSDLAVAAVKTGMLGDRGVVLAVAARAAAGELPHLVVDPVMVSSSGHRLLSADAETAYVDELFPHAEVVTPNIREASVLVGAEVATLADMEEAARQIGRSGPGTVVVKGGDLGGEVSVDVVWDGAVMSRLEAPRIETGNNHGTGCSFAAATAARLAAGDDLAAGVRSAKHYVHRAIAGGAGWRLGAGHGPLDHLGWTGSSR
jgi:hydroxymethylpyrimidine/phosphomethylpyrimidine kinase